jgi:hypothetical protein
MRLVSAATPPITKRRDRRCTSIERGNLVRAHPAEYTDRRRHVLLTVSQEMTRVTFWQSVGSAISCSNSSPLRLDFGPSTSSVTRQASTRPSRLRSRRWSKAFEHNLAAAVDAAGGQVALSDGRTVSTGRAEFDAVLGRRRRRAWVVIRKNASMPPGR